MSKPLTPEERAALRKMAEWRAREEQRYDDAGIGGLTLRLLDERDALAVDDGSVQDLVNQLTDSWQAATSELRRARRWARAWKAAAYSERDRAEGAEAAARFHEDDATLQLAATVRAQRWARAWKAAAKDLRRKWLTTCGNVYSLAGELAPTEARALAAEEQADTLRSESLLSRADAALWRARAYRVRLERDALRARVAELADIVERNAGRVRVSFDGPALRVDTDTGTRWFAEHPCDLRAFAARAVRLLDRKWRVCPECRCLIWEDEPAPGPHAPDCALAVLLRECCEEGMK